MSVLNLAYLWTNEMQLESFVFTYWTFMVYFEEIIVHAGVEVASTTSRYRKLVVSSEYEMNFREWTFWCSGELLTLS